MKKIQIEDLDSDSDLDALDLDSDLDAQDSVLVLDSVAQDSVLVLDSEGVDSTTTLVSVLIKGSSLSSLFSILIMNITFSVHRNNNALLEIGMQCSVKCCNMLQWFVGRPPIFTDIASASIFPAMIESLISSASFTSSYYSCLGCYLLNSSCQFTHDVGLDGCFTEIASL